ncbi:hypothetical protein C2S52_005683 [Perilla frutescens var. hirtella]|nr:hypothetical protein C2S52_005683 [Perilla frutescens var. hirtella]
MGDEVSMIKIGPVGGSKIYVNAIAWDEKGHNEIVQIFVSHDDSGINSIQFQYAQNGNLVLSKRHGFNGVSKYNAVKLDYPMEYITCISGRWNNNDGLCSITFGTNFREYGPFGDVIKYDHDKEFCFELGVDRQFGGFHGTVAFNYVISIGVYIKPNMTLDNSGSMVKL